MFKLKQERNLYPEIPYCTVKDWCLLDSMDFALFMCPEPTKVVDT